MSERDGRRKCDNGIRKLVRDFLPTTLMVSVIFGSGVFYQAQAESKKNIAGQGKAISEIVKIQRQQATANGRVEAALSLIQEQQRLILQTLLKPK